MAAVLYILYIPAKPAAAVRPEGLEVGEEDPVRLGDDMRVIICGLLW